MRPHWTPHDCAGGLLAVTPATPSDTDTLLSRRTVLSGAASLAISTLALANTVQAAPSKPTANKDPVATSVALESASATPVPSGIIGYVFNAKTQDVTLFDPATREVLATRPLGAVVRWLSNEQRFWDGRHIWTYDFPKDRVQAIGVDPRAVAVERILPTGGTGPAHSLMLTPNHTTAWVNVAGGNYLAVLDLATGDVVDEVKTGAFPWDLHFSPDGRFGFTPERDQDTVSKIDLVSRKIVKTVPFPQGSKPYMLRVSPHDSIVWVQTAGTHSNVVLDVETLETLHEEPTGKGPVQSVFGPVAGRYGLVTHLEESFVLVLDQATGREVRRIDVGGPQANASFTPDGAIAYVTLTSQNEVVAIDMANLEVVGRISAGEEPMGLVLFDPTTSWA